MLDKTLLRVLELFQTIKTSLPSKMNCLNFNVSIKKIKQL